MSGLTHVTDLLADAGIPFELASVRGEALAHIAFYAGWANAIQATMTVKQFFDERGA